MAPREAWDRAENILCVRLDSIGDVLMTTPALRALRESRPGRRLRLLTSEAGVLAAAHVPEIDSAISYAAPWMKASSPRADGAPDRRMAARLRRERFDAAVVFTVFSQNPLPPALLCLLADIPLRLAHSRENPYGLLTDWVPEPEPEKFIRHEVRRQLDLVATIGCRPSHERLSFYVPGEARERVAGRLEEAGLDRAGRWAIFHPGATAPSRRYPPEMYGEAARLLTGCGWTIVFTGSEAEIEMVEMIRAEMGVPSVSLAGRLNLGELGALIEIAPVLVANNTGPAHIAAALGTPVVDLYALTNPQHTPWGVPNRVLNHDVPCKYCYKSICPEGHHHCLRLVPPRAVVEAAMEVAR